MRQREARHIVTRGILVIGLLQLEWSQVSLSAERLALRSASLLPKEGTYPDYAYCEGDRFESLNQPVAGWSGTRGQKTSPAIATHSPYPFVHNSGTIPVSAPRNEGEPQRQRIDGRGRDSLREGSPPSIYLQDVSTGPQESGSQTEIGRSLEDQPRLG